MRTAILVVQVNAGRSSGRSNARGASARQPTSTPLATPLSMRCAMRKLFLGCATAALCSAVLFAADDRVRVTLNGCVNGGDSPNTYVLTDVSEVSQGKKTPATAVY